MSRLSEWPNARLFIDGGVRNDLLKKQLEHPMNPTESVDQWVKRVIGTDDFCMALNDVCTYEDSIVEFFAEAVTVPASERHGVLAGGYEAYAFVGKYDATPFGIHEDPDHSILVHLGPAPQEVMFWDRTSYSDLVGEEGLGQINFDIESKSQAAVKITMEPGDLILIPKGDYHVFMRPSYSMMLGLIPRPSSREKFVQHLVAEHLRSWKSRADDASYYRPSNTLEHCDGCTEAGVMELPLQLAGRALAMRLESNGYFSKPPRLSPGLDASVSGTTRFTRSPSFPIRYRGENDKTILYVRGRELRINTVPGLDSLIAFINNQTSFEFASLRSVVQDVWSEELLIAFLNKLVTLNAIRIGAEVSR